MSLGQIANKFRMLFLKDDAREKEREHIEDVLKALYHSSVEGQPFDIDLLMKMSDMKQEYLPHILKIMEMEGLINAKDYKLSPLGEKRALSIIRRHRLYEAYLSEKSGYDANEWHELAHRKEHSITDKELDKMSEILRNPLFDPHGDPIPTIHSLRLPKKEKSKNVNLVEGRYYRIEHIEDDNKDYYVLYNQLSLVNSIIFKVVKINAIYLEFEIYGERKSIARDMLSNIDYREATPEEVALFAGYDLFPLTRLREGETAIVHSISPASKGYARRRLMDLGFVSMSEVKIDLRSPMGNPTAYLIRGASIALRDDQAHNIIVRLKN